jgi:RNA-directed DNA polymerase
LIAYGYQRNKYNSATAKKLIPLSPSRTSRSLFYSLYDKVYRTDVLWEAWQQVKANQGVPGVDGESIEAIVEAGGEAQMIQALQSQLRDKSYQFQPVRRVDIPKP